MFDLLGKYQELDCISSDGSLYINTELMLFYGYKYELGFRYDNIYSARPQNKILGCGPNPDNTSPKYINCISCPRLDTNCNTFQPWISTSVVLMSPQVTIRDLLGNWFNIKVDLSIGHKIILYNDDLKFEGSIPNNFPLNFTSNSYVYLFRSSSEVYDPSISSISYFKLYDSRNKLIQDLHPCKRIIDGEVGMYDTVTKQFFANQGTGSFIAGPETGNYL